MKIYFKAVDDHSIAISCMDGTIEGFDGLNDIETMLADQDFKNGFIAVLAATLNAGRRLRRPYNVFNDVDKKEYKYSIDLPLTFALKVMLWNELLKRHMRWTDLCDLTGLSAAQMGRVADFEVNTRLETLEQCVKAIDMSIEAKLV